MTKLIDKKTLKALDNRLSVYCNDSKIRQRWAKVIIARAVRFYCDDCLDSLTAKEDLYQEDDKLVNLGYSEKNFIDF